jgi:hypothetical protein
VAADDDNVGVYVVCGLNDDVDGRTRCDVKPRRPFRRRAWWFGRKSLELGFGVAGEIETGLACSLRQQRLLRMEHVQRSARLTGKSAREQEGSARRVGEVDRH